MLPLCRGVHTPPTTRMASISDTDKSTDGEVQWTIIVYGSCSRDPEDYDERLVYATKPLPAPFTADVACEISRL